MPHMQLCGFNFVEQTKCEKYKGTNIYFYLYQNEKLGNHFFAIIIM
jgi:hypothetical protein